MTKVSGILIFTSCLILQRLVIAVEVAPHISDREIVEGLTEIRGDIKRLDAGINSLRSEMKGDIKRLEDGQKALDIRIDDLRSEIKSDVKRLEDGQKALDKRIDDLRSEINSRFDSLHWTLGIFITIALVILGFVLRMQWQMHHRQTRMETVLETQRDELSFIKKIIEKFLPPRGVL